MTHFDVSKLNVDPNRLVLTRADLDTLVGAFKDTVRASAEVRDPELLHTLCSGMGEPRLLSTIQHDGYMEKPSKMDAPLQAVAGAKARE
jgi:hypothetical protein